MNDIPITKPMRHRFPASASAQLTRLVMANRHLLLENNRTRKPDASMLRRAKWEQIADEINRAFVGIFHCTSASCQAHFTHKQSTAAAKCRAAQTNRWAPSADRLSPSPIAAVTIKNNMTVDDGDRILVSSENISPKRNRDKLHEMQMKVLKAQLSAAEAQERAGNRMMRAAEAQERAGNKMSRLADYLHTFIAEGHLNQGSGEPNLYYIEGDVVDS